MAVAKQSNKPRKPGPLSEREGVRGVPSSGRAEQLLTDLHMSNRSSIADMAPGDIVLLGHPLVSRRSETGGANVLRRRYGNLEFVTGIPSRTITPFMRAVLVGTGPRPRFHAGKAEGCPGLLPRPVRRTQDRPTLQPPARHGSFQRARHDRPPPRPIHHPRRALGSHDRHARQECLGLCPGPDGRNHLCHRPDREAANHERFTAPSRPSTSSARPPHSSLSRIPSNSGSATGSSKIRSPRSLASLLPTSSGASCAPTPRSS